VVQERNQNREALEAVKGPLGDAYNLEGERDLMVASLTVCPLLINCVARDVCAVLLYISTTFW
jgi:hypothetical protein